MTKGERAYARGPNENKIVDVATKETDYRVFRNAVPLKDPQTGGPHTSHTTNPVPFVLLGSGVKAVRDGRLADLAPTMLELMGVAPPVEMTGTSLIKRG